MVSEWNILLKVDFAELVSLVQRSEMLENRLIQSLPIEFGERRTLPKGHIV